MDASVNDGSVDGDVQVVELRATDGKPQGSIIQSQAVNNVIITNDKVYLTSVHGDGNNTPFSYHLQTFQPDSEGNNLLWEFGA